MLKLRWAEAEREGFEPPEACASTVFKTAAFDRSAISPAQKYSPVAGEKNRRKPDPTAGCFNYSEVFSDFPDISDFPD